MNLPSTNSRDAAWRLNENEARVAALSRVSRETGAKLDLFVSELARWQEAKNLVGPATLRQIWLRHVLDSMQLEPIAGDARGLWLDLGSGGGLPGVIMAVIRTDAAKGPTLLVESNQRKCAFLLHCVRILQLDAEVAPRRIEDLMSGPPADVGIVSARALAPLRQLLAWTSPLLKKGAVGIFPKGQDVEKEIAEASRYWDFEADRVPSETDPSARILKLRMASQSGAARHEP